MHPITQIVFVFAFIWGLFIFGDISFRLQMIQKELKEIRDTLNSLKEECSE